MTIIYWERWPLAVAAVAITLFGVALRHLPLGKDEFMNDIHTPDTTNPVDDLVKAIEALPGDLVIQSVVEEYESFGWPDFRGRIEIYGNYEAVRPVLSAFNEVARRARARDARAMASPPAPRIQPGKLP